MGVGPGAAAKKYGLTQVVALISGLTGSGIASATCTGSERAGSILVSSTPSILDVPSIFLVVYYTGSPAPAVNAITVASRLTYDPNTETLGLDYWFPQQLNSTIVAALPSALPNVGALASVTDGTSITDCVTGGGTNYVHCRATAAGWVPDTYGAAPTGTGIVNTVSGVYQPPYNSGNLVPIADLPVGATGSLGVLSPDGTSCTAVAGVLTCTGGGSGSPGGVNGQTQINAAGGFGGASQDYWAQAADTFPTTVESLCASHPCVYHVNLPLAYTLGASHAMNSNVTLDFGPYGKLTGSGAFSLTNVQITPQSALTQHFAGAVTVGFANTVTLAPVEWFGAVDDWNGSSGTDNTAAIQATEAALTYGNVLLQVGCYKTTNVLTFNKNNVGMQGIAGKLKGHDYGSGIPGKLLHHP